MIINDNMEMKRDEDLELLLTQAVAEERELSILTRYKERKMTRARAASLLKISERQVNRLMEDHGLERVEGERKKRDEAAAARKTLRESAARLALAGRVSHKQAAARAGCSERTIYRYIDKLKRAKKKRT